MYSFPNYNIRLPIKLMTKKNTRKYFLLFLASFKFLECKETLFYDSISKNINILITDGVGQMPKTCEFILYSCVWMTTSCSKSFMKFLYRQEHLGCLAA